MKNASYFAVLCMLIVSVSSCSNAPFTLPNNNANMSPVQITLMKGQIKTPTNKVQNFTPVQLTLTTARCKTIHLQTSEINLPIKVCYRGKTVTLDGTLFNYIPLWKQGFVYPAVTTANLINADIKFQLTP